MKKTIFLSFILAILFCLIQVETSKAQVMLKKASLEKQIDNSSLVIEGQVIAKRSFFGKDGLIYTANQVEVYKIFKGESDRFIEVITVGGTVGLKALISSTSLKLRKNDVGVFMLNNSRDQLNSKSNIKEYKPYGSLQGYYRYNLLSDIAVNPFNKKQGISSSFYNEIINYTQKDFIVISDFDAQPKKVSNTSKVGLLAPSSLTLSTLEATAGTKEVLTITGSGFGNTIGKVWFSNADDGGSTFISALDSQVTWGDTEIMVEIPSSAGTGPIFVEDSSLAQSPLSSTLTISYAEINVEYDTGTEIEAFQVQHVEDNGNGGYTWEMQTNFFDDDEHPGARAAFERAFETWRCTTKVNWDISDTATVTDVIGIADLTEPLDGELDAEGVNVIRFDNGNELGVDVLGTCYSWYSGCSNIGGEFFWYVSELDIVFDDATTWYFGTGFPGAAYDFESVALHELGHGHQLGHVINTNEVMHYNLGLSEYLRDLSTDDITGALGIHTRSIGSSVCAQPLMTDSTICNLSTEENELNEAIIIYPNPVKEQFYIRNTSSISLQKATIYDIGGRLVSDYDISNTSRINAISLNGISKGIYFLNIYSELATITKKLVVN